MGEAKKYDDAKREEIILDLEKRLAQVEEKLAALDAAKKE